MSSLFSVHLLVSLFIAQSSSGSECEVIKKPRLPTPTHKQQHRQSCKKSKARTKLSPLLENSYSPIFKDPSHLPNPSPLTTALATTPTRGVSFNMIPQTSALPHPPPPPSHGTTHTSSFLTTAQSSLPLVPPIPRPTSLFEARVLASTIGGGTGSLIGRQPLLSGSSPTNPTLHYNSFPAVSGLLKTSQQQQQQQFHQVSTPHASQTLLGPISISQLHHSTLPFNPLVPACSTQALQGYNNANMIYNTPGVIPPPGYMPLVMTTPTQAMGTPNYLYTQYGHGMQTMPLDRNTEQRIISSMEKKTLQSVPPWFIFSNNRSEKVCNMRVYGVGYLAPTSYTKYSQ